MNDNKMFVECKVFNHGGVIPVEYTGRGADISPEFIVHNLPAGTESIAIIMDDIEHPIFKVFNHWTIWNLPPNEVIQKGIPAGEILPQLGNAQQGIGYGKHCYAGPKPPKGTQHEYCFVFYALRQRVDIKSKIRKKQLLRVIEPFVIQSASIIGRYE